METSTPFHKTENNSRRYKLGVHSHGERDGSGWVGGDKAVCLQIKELSQTSVWGTLMCVYDIHFIGHLLWT